MQSSLEIFLLSSAVAVFNWATNTFNCGFLNDFFTVTSNNTIALKQTSLFTAFISAVNKNLFQGGRWSLEIYEWLPTELKEGSGISNHVAILTGTSIILSFFLILIPVSVIFVSCSCHCCIRKNAENKPAKVSSVLIFS